MAQIRNNEDRILDINLSKIEKGKVIRLMPGLTPVNDEDWALALPLKWTRKLFDRKAISGPKEVNGVTLWGLEPETKSEPETKGGKKKGGKEPENFG